MAKKPRTMVGMPAIVSRIGLTMFRTRVDAYSASRIADSRPSGVPMSIAMTATSSVPLTSGRTPNAYGWIDADQTVPVRKSIGLTTWKNWSVWIQQDHDDPDRRDDAERGGHEQQRLDDPFGPWAPSASAGAVAALIRDLSSTLMGALSLAQAR